MICDNNDDCKKNFAIVEAHHDFCLHDDVPQDVEIGFHDLEEACGEKGARAHCYIGRLPDPDHEKCDLVPCPEDGGPQVDAIGATLNDNNCSANCATATCTDAFRTLRVLHDLCGFTDDSDDHSGHDHDHSGHRRMQDVDAELHRFEEPCDAVACYVEMSSHCSGSTADLASLDSLKERAAEKCFVTSQEAQCCPTTGTGCSVPTTKPQTDASRGSRMGFA